MRRTRVLGTLTLAALAATCSGDTSPTSLPPPVPATTIRITSTGVTPKSVEISLGSRVLFINQDTQNHNMGSDPHPDHNDCPVINQVGLLRPGEQRETGNFVIARTCGFHDHDLPLVTSLWGSIVTR